MTVDQTGTANLRVVLRSPTDSQLKFLRSQSKRKIVKAGRRFGKTVASAIWNVEQFCDGHRCLYAVPVSDQLEAFWKEITTALAQGITDGILVKNETEHLIEWNPGIIERIAPASLCAEQTKKGQEARRTREKYLNNRIRCKTAYNADTLRGDFADRLTIDELQLCDESAWELVGAPMLMQNNGDALFLFTPPSLRSRSASKATDKQWARKFYKKHTDDPRWLCMHFTSYDNPTLSAEGIAEVAKDMTAIARRQEILAEDIDEVPGALWTRALLEKTRVQPQDVPELMRIVVGVDPTGSTTNEAGIVAVGIGANGHHYFTNDESVLGSPEKWGGGSVRLYHRLKADRIVAEKNYGGDMVASTLQQVDKHVPITLVVSTRGKLVRAEPICALFEQGRAHIVGELPELEDQMCQYVPGDKSPNRLDAAVFGSTDLLSCGIGGNLSNLNPDDDDAPQNIMHGIFNQTI